jgi:hypothetical protein
MNDLVVSINKMYSGINACRVGNLRLWMEIFFYVTGFFIVID